MDANREKSLQACLQCRQKRIRCDGTRPNCQSCDKRGVECTFPTEPPKKRGPKPKSKPAAAPGAGAGEARAAAKPRPSQAARVAAPKSATHRKDAGGGSSGLLGLASHGALHANERAGHARSHSVHYEDDVSTDAYHEEDAEEDTGDASGTGMDYGDEHGMDSFNDGDEEMLEEDAGGGSGASLAPPPPASLPLHVHPPDYVPHLHMPASSPFTRPPPPIYPTLPSVAFDGYYHPLAHHHTPPAGHMAGAGAGAGSAGGASLSNRMMGMPVAAVVPAASRDGSRPSRGNGRGGTSGSRASHAASHANTGIASKVFAQKVPSKHPFAYRDYEEEGMLMGLNGAEAGVQSRDVGDAYGVDDEGAGAYDGEGEEGGESGAGGVNDSAAMQEEEEEEEGRGRSGNGGRASQLPSSSSAVPRAMPGNSSSSSSAAHGTHGKTAAYMYRGAPEAAATAEGAHSAAGAAGVASSSGGARGSSSAGGAYGSVSSSGPRRSAAAASRHGASSHLALPVEEEGADGDHAGRRGGSGHPHHSHPHAGHHHHHDHGHEHSHHHAHPHGHHHHPHAGHFHGGAPDAAGHDFHHHHHHDDGHGHHHHHDGHHHHHHHPHASLSHPVAPAAGSEAGAAAVPAAAPPFSSPHAHLFSIPVVTARDRDAIDVFFKHLNPSASLVDEDAFNEVLSYWYTGIPAGHAHGAMPQYWWSCPTRQEPKAAPAPAAKKLQKSKSKGGAAAAAAAPGTEASAGSAAAPPLEGQEEKASQAGEPQAESSEQGGAAKASGVVKADSHASSGVSAPPAAMQDEEGEEGEEEEEEEERLTAAFDPSSYVIGPIDVAQLALYYAVLAVGYRLLKGADGQPLPGGMAKAQEHFSRARGLALAVIDEPCHPLVSAFSVLAHYGVGMLNLTGASLFASFAWRLARASGLVVDQGGIAHGVLLVRQCACPDLEPVPLSPRLAPPRACEVVETAKGLHHRSAHVAAPASGGSSGSSSGNPSAAAGTAGASGSRLERTPSMNGAAPAAGTGSSTTSSVSSKPEYPGPTGISGTWTSAEGPFPPRAGNAGPGSSSSSASVTSGGGGGGGAAPSSSSATAAAAATASNNGSSPCGSMPEIPEMPFPYCASSLRLVCERADKLVCISCCEAYGTICPSGTHAPPAPGCIMVPLAAVETRVTELLSFSLSRMMHIRRGLLSVQKKREVWATINELIGFLMLTRVGMSYGLRGTIAGLKAIACRQEGRPEDANRWAYRAASYFVRVPRSEASPSFMMLFVLRNVALMVVSDELEQLISRKKAAAVATSSVSGSSRGSTNSALQPWEAGTAGTSGSVGSGSEDAPGTGSSGREASGDGSGAPTLPAVTDLPNFDALAGHVRSCSPHWPLGTLFYNAVMLEAAAIHAAAGRVLIAALANAKAAAAAAAVAAAASVASAPGTTPADGSAAAASPAVGGQATSSSSSGAATGAAAGAAVAASGASDAVSVAVLPAVADPSGSPHYTSLMLSARAGGVHVIIPSSYVSQGQTLGRSGSAGAAAPTAAELGMLDLGTPMPRPGEKAGEGVVLLQHQRHVPSLPLGPPATMLGHRGIDSAAPFRPAEAAAAAAAPSVGDGGAATLLGLVGLQPATARPGAGLTAGLLPQLMTSAATGTSAAATTAPGPVTNASAGAGSSTGAPPEPGRGKGKMLMLSRPPERAQDDHLIGHGDMLTPIIEGTASPFPLGVAGGAGAGGQAATLQPPTAPVAEPTLASFFEEMQRTAASSHAAAPGRGKAASMFLSRGQPDNRGGRPGAAAAAASAAQLQRTTRSGLTISIPGGRGHSSANGGSGAADAGGAAGPHPCHCPACFTVSHGCNCPVCIGNAAAGRAGLGAPERSMHAPQNIAAQAPTAATSLGPAAVAVLRYVPPLGPSNGALPTGILTVDAAGIPQARNEKQILSYLTLTKNLLSAAAPEEDAAATEEGWGEGEDDADTPLAVSVRAGVATDFTRAGQPLQAAQIPALPLHRNAGTLPNMRGSMSTGSASHPRTVSVTSWPADVSGSATGSGRRSSGRAAHAAAAERHALAADGSPEPSPLDVLLQAITEDEQMATQNASGGSGSANGAASGAASEPRDGGAGGMHPHGSMEGPSSAAAPGHGLAGRKRPASSSSLPDQPPAKR